MSQKKTHLEYTLKEISEELSALAGDISRGQLRLGAGLISIERPASFKVKQKLKGFTASCEISFTAVVTNHNEAKSTAGHLKERAEITPAPAKHLKKEMARLWKVIVHKIGSGSPLPDDETDYLLKLCDTTMYAGEKWHGEWIICCDNLNRCINAARQGSYELARQLAEEINTSFHGCHKKYK